MIGKSASLKLLEGLVGESGADQTEAVLFCEDSALTRFTHSAIHQHVAERNHTLILRVVLDKKIAVVTTNILEPSSLQASLEKALSLARIQQRQEAFVSLPAPKAIPSINTYFESISRLTPQRKAKALRAIISRAKEKGLSASGAFSHGKVEVSIVNSLGLKAYQKYSDVFLHLIVENEANSGYAGFVSRDSDKLNPEILVEEALRRVSSREAVQMAPGEYEVILEPYAVHELLMFMAHLGFHALAVQEGRSFLGSHFGEKLVNEKITIYDDGGNVLGLPVPFDFEGVPKQKVTFFEKGVVKQVTHDCFTAGKEGKESTGHALMAPNTEGPVPFNLFMEGGDSSLAEMIRSTSRGIYITRFHYTNVVEPMKAVMTGMTRDGTFLIEGGEIKVPIKNLRFTESILRALSRVKAISKDRRLCSEGTVYSRRFVTGSVVPALKIDGFNFSGVSDL